MRLPTSLLWLILACSYPHHSVQEALLGERDLSKLTTGQIKTLVELSDPVVNLNPDKPNSHVSKILIPRVSGTEGNTKVREYIVSKLTALKWHVELDSFTDTTPLGVKNFTNIIATKDPAASRRLVLSAHFDSKYFMDMEFLGAVDSAASCALMIDLAETLDPLLDARVHHITNNDVFDEEDDTTLQLIFFDGEEAFVAWTDTDSIYGARHLADTWSTSYVSPHEKRRLVMSSTETQISTIEHLILLDLIGAANPHIKSYFVDTVWLYNGLLAAESRLKSQGFFDSEKDWKSFFKGHPSTTVNFGYIGDDHVPFMKHGVSVLHVIPEPFPSVWHNQWDNAKALHMPTLRRWNLIFRVFLVEYLHLNPIAKATASREEGSLDSHNKRSEEELG